MIRSLRHTIPLVPPMISGHATFCCSCRVWQQLQPHEGLQSARGTLQRTKPSQRRRAGYPSHSLSSLVQIFLVLRLQGLAAAAATREAAKRKGHSAEDQSAPKKARRVPIISHEVAIPKGFLAKDLSEDLHGEPCSLFDHSFPHWAADSHTMQRLDRSA